MNEISFGRVLGFPLAVQPSAFFILGLLVLSAIDRGGAGGVGFGVLLGVLTFGSVLVHELGHALAARAFRLGPVSITLHGFGGFTRFDRAPRPGQGVLVTLAGPFASLALGLVALLGAFFLPGSGSGPAGAHELLWRLATINLFWGAFNLLPMYPLDGGLVTWHGLSLLTPRDTALRWTARLGLLVAVFVGTVSALAGEIFIAVVAAMSLFQSAPLAFAAVGRRPGR